MKTIAATLAFLFAAQCFAAPASEFKGTYQVIEKCQANNSRLGPLDLMAFEGNIVDIDVDAKNGLLLFSAEHNTLALPFSSNTKLQPFAFEDYYSDADIRVTANTYALRTKGSEWGTCDNYPFPGHRPCRHKWDDAVGMQVTANGQIQIEWKVEAATGTCTLKAVK